MFDLAVRAAVEQVDEALESGDALVLLSALQAPSLCLRGLLRDYSPWYLETLASDREQKALVKGLDLPLMLKTLFVKSNLFI